ncbi:MAG: hypothetical protein A2V90_01720 [Gammaproteobacteria bacterium RBG_16_57_12]|nr:MAG: hypothetical protein A2V90_01720 [Gammaproteobacteria bacterium RBG_16_57_12]
MEAEIELDVSMLEPPEPLQRILNTIHTINPGQYLKVLHHREPFPLYPILEREGFTHNTRQGQVMPFEIFIWRMNDSAAQEKAAQAMGL